ncbi:MAG: helical backbone metal receptor [Oscillospiraceae bacterium]|nr:helical backbone metal receptor [Oscillospiraceae bacterium]
MFSVYLLFLMSGCDKDGGEIVQEPDITEEPPEPTPFPLFIGDVEITQSPPRVVSLSPSLSEIVYELGYGSRIIGRGSYCDFPPVITEAPDTGSAANPDVDKIISLSPYLVLTTAPLSGMDMFRMEQSGIKTLVIPASENISSLREVYRVLGLVFEGLFTGIEAGDEAFALISKVCDNTGVLNIGKFVYITGDMKAATGDTLESSIFSCFGENIAADGGNYDFDLSLLSENQPDIILLNDKYTADDLLASENFSELDAVIGGKIIFIDNSAFERPSIRLALLVEKMIADYRDLQ